MYILTCLMWSSEMSKPSCSDIKAHVSFTVSLRILAYATSAVPHTHTILFKNCLHIESNVFNIFIYPVSTFGLQKKNISTYFKSDYLFLTTVTK